jgi:hypothetical protein
MEEVVAIMVQILQ